ncbi:glycosyl transferase family 2 [Candidatus Roizmanbacteria bacterium CG_4_10_14_0_8_um_filter_39_9]|uniref:Glycosyl transferase family 2 n=1 Tax=Candidatus Roizmanbacteria bacterium CG_4_10_14_0_8_um_filter_39_9 TaxID=1974829 RepID=A0A2M7QF69_9BACT|nr:MAG: glycosyl transferase family 2 [Candidatus Roizmanbacteria bacterium CG_4_10_14_0_8_um_filter_39_9]
MKKDLSVIIASFNTKDITLKCIQQLREALQTSMLCYEIVVVDNASQDGSKEMLQAIQKDDMRLILNKTNTGYGKANNQGLAVSQGDFALYLNSDVFVDDKIHFKDLIEHMRSHKHIGALTVQVNLPDESIDPASHRGFPTLWRSFCYFVGLEKIFKNIPLLNKIFGGYHLVHLNKQLTHEIDSPTGAFFLAPQPLLKKLKGFDEDFFMYGEDIDLAFRIKELGYKIVYYPVYRVLHFKYQSGLKKKNDPVWQKKVRGFFYEALAIFYRKHYAKLYPFVINWFVYALIDLKKRAV